MHHWLIMKGDPAGFNFWPMHVSKSGQRLAGKCCREIFMSLYKTVYTAFKLMFY